MATETTTKLDAIRDWLKLVGEEYAIREVHHIKRPDDSLKPGGKSRGLHQWFTYRWESSEQIQTQPTDQSTASGNDADMDFYAPFNRRLRIECHSEHGMEVMEALLLSAWHPAVEDHLGAARLVIVEMPDGITNETVDDESDVEHMYSATFIVRTNTHFTLTRANHIWSNYNMTGTLTLLDDVSTVDVTCTDT